MIDAILEMCNAHLHPEPRKMPFAADMFLVVRYLVMDFRPGQFIIFDFDRNNVVCNDGGYLNGRRLEKWHNGGLFQQIEETNMNCR